MSQPTREIYWNIGIEEPFRTMLMVLLSLVPVFYVLGELQERWRLWHVLGREEKFPPRSEWGWRAKRVLDHVVQSRRLKRRDYAGTMHGLILGSFILLFIGTLIVAFQSDVAAPLFDWHFFKGGFYKLFSLILEVAGVAGIIGCAMALRRRYTIKPKSLGNGLVKWTSTLWTLLIILVTGFMIEGIRIAANPAQWEYEKIWSFVGYLFSLAIPKNEAVMRHTHFALWWGHLFLSIAFLCTFAGTAMGHIFTTTITVFMAREIPSGASPRPIENIEETEQFGVLAVEQFRQEHLRDADSCVECGRCTDVCPAQHTGKPLDPKRIIGQIRHGWLNLVEIVERGDKLPDVEDRPQLVGDLITADELWSCTTCGACEQECPVMIEQVEKIVEMRRGLVLMRSEFPGELQRLFTNLENYGNPWGKDPGERTAWAEGLDFTIPIAGEEGTEHAEYLFWPGCAGAYDARSKPISKAFARLMNRAGVKFCILGSSETCTGDSALRAGNEYLYQVLAKQNIETLKTIGKKTIVTTCPHCLQTLSKDYKALGFELEVVHHSQLIAHLRAEGRLSLEDTEPAKKNGSSPAIEREVAIHDSCYLARHNNIIEEPRAVAEMGSGHAAIDPPRARDNGFCCGAGGARMWMEEHLGHKTVNTERSEELAATGANTVVTSCPFCKTMISDGMKGIGKEQDVDVLDIAELLDKRMGTKKEQHATEALRH